MLNNSQARKIINDHVKSFLGVEQNRIQLFNQPNFKPPKDGLWCRVTIQYSESFESCLYKGAMIRDYGIINIQIFARKGTGDVALIALADDWRDHWNGFNVSHFEVMKSNAPTEPYNELETDFVGVLVRVDFRVN